MPGGRRQHRQLAFSTGSVDLALFFVVCGAYTMTFAVAERLSKAFALFTLVAVMQIVYLGIYALEHFEVIDDERCDRLIESAQKQSLVDNFFAQDPPPNRTARQMPMRALAFMARSAARLVELVEDHYAEEEGNIE